MYNRPAQAGADLTPHLDGHHLVPAVEAAEQIRCNPFAASLSQWLKAAQPRAFAVGIEAVQDLLSRFSAAFRPWGSLGGPDSGSRSSTGESRGRGSSTTS